MSQESELWGKARAAFVAHQIRGIDHTPQHALNRIAAKCLRLSFDDTSCAIREELLDLDDLNRLEVYHDQRGPGRDHEPIVVLSFRGRRYVIDGNKRVSGGIPASPRPVEPSSSNRPTRATPTG